MLRALALTSATLAFAFAACGDSSDHEFRDDYDTVSRELDEIGEHVQAALQAAESKSGAQLARQFGGFAGELADVRDDLAELEPPSHAEDDVEKLDRAIAGVQESLQDIADAAERHDARAERTAALALIQRGQRLDDVEQAVKAEAAE